MNASQRRHKLFTILKESKSPITGSELADMLKVSRQVIVQDVAILRAAGRDILATSQGYLIDGNSEIKTLTATIACKHTKEEVEDELMTIVNYGARIIDVIVEHPIYGELKGLLMIQTPADVKDFMKKYRTGEADLLSALTGGVHLHTINVMNEEVITRLKVALKKKGFLLDS